DRLPAVRRLAVHPACARVERTDRLSGASVPGLPAADRSGGGLGTGGRHGPYAGSPCGAYGPYVRACRMLQHSSVAQAAIRRPALVSGGRRAGWVMVVTGIVGWLAAFQLSVDDWRLLKDPSYQPACNISPIVSCGSVMSSPEGSVFGFPNMLLGLGAFAAV